MFSNDAANGYIYHSPKVVHTLTVHGVVTRLDSPSTSSWASLVPRPETVALLEDTYDRIAS